MLDRVRQQTRGRRRGASTVEYSLLVAAIAVVVALVAFAFGSYLHSALRPACNASAPSSTSTSCSQTSH